MTASYLYYLTLGTTTVILNIHDVAIRYCVVCWNGLQYLWLTTSKDNYSCGEEHC